MTEIEEVPEEGMEKFERISAHTHIRGLGLKEDGTARDTGDGMVGQKKAREAAGRVVELVRKGKLGGRLILFAGPPGTGKTALAVGIARELGGREVPFVNLSGSEIYSSEKKKTDILTESLRKALGIRLREKRDVYEGEVTSLDVKTGQAGLSPYQQAPSEARITLRTKDEEKTLRLGRSVAASLQSQQVEEGSIIQIDAETGRVINLGVSRDTWEKEEKADISVSPELVDVPTGSIMREREFVSTLNIHQIDSVAAARSAGGLSLFFGGGETEITDEIRQRTNKQVRTWIEEGKGELLPGVLFLDEVHMLDIEAFSFLNRAIEEEFSPITIMASNRGLTKIRGTDYESPHGMPLDSLDRLLIIDTHPYKKKEIKSILKIRAKEEDAELDEEAFDFLSEVGENTSMRYAVQLIAPTSEIAESNGRKKATREDVEEARRLFISVGDSVDILKKYEERMMG